MSVEEKAKLRPCMYNKIFYVCQTRHDYKKHPCKRCNFRRTIDDNKYYSHECMFTERPIDWIF